jgi:hypothetical protein
LNPVVVLTAAGEIGNIGGGAENQTVTLGVNIRGVIVDEDGDWSVPVGVHSPAGFTLGINQLHIMNADGGSPAQIILVGIPVTETGTAFVSGINFLSDEAMRRTIHAVSYRPSVASGIPGSFVVDEARIALWDTREVTLPSRP